VSGQDDSVPPVATPCPQDGCCASAEVIDRFTLWSTDGKIIHLKIRCRYGHWFTLPVGPEPVLRDLVSLMGFSSALTLPSGFDMELADRAL
jgi:hypothetical protein